MTRPAPEPAPRFRPGPALAALLAETEPAERPRLLELRRDWFARLLPADGAETAAAEAIVAAVWRAERLVALEARAVGALLAGAPAAGLPTLATLARLRARLDQERRAAERDLATLRELRPPAQAIPILDPDRLAWLAEKIREGRGRVPTRPAHSLVERPAHTPPTEPRPTEPRSDEPRPAEPGAAPAAASETRAAEARPAEPRPAAPPPAPATAEPPRAATA